MNITTQHPYTCHHAFKQFTLQLIVALITGYAIFYATAIPAQASNESLFKNATHVKIAVNSKKDSYKVNEALKFTIEGKEDFYLYIFNRTNNKPTLMYPHIQTKSNFFKAGTTYTIPKNIEFHSGHRGIKKLLFIATHQQINLPSTPKGKTIMLSEDWMSEDRNSINDGGSYDLGAVQSAIHTKQHTNTTQESDSDNHSYINQTQPMAENKGFSLSPKLITIRIDN